MGQFEVGSLVPAAVVALSLYVKQSCMFSGLLNFLRDKGAAPNATLVKHTRHKVGAFRTTMIPAL